MLESPNLKKEHMTPSPRKQDISSKYPLDRKFTPLGQSIETALEELCAHNLITLPNTRPRGFTFLSNYCAYHRENKHKTLDCMELKHRIQDLRDNDVIEIEDPNDSPKEKLDVITKNDQNDEPMSSKAPHVASTSSTMSSSPKASQQKSIPSPSNNEPKDDTFHVDPQGLSPMEIQANPNLDTRSCNYLKIQDYMPSCTPIPNIPTPESSIQKASPSCQNMNSFQESPMPMQNPIPSLEVASCQEDNLKNEEISPIINQDQDTKTPQSHTLVDQDLIPLESHHDASSTFSNDPIQTEEPNTLSTLSNGPLPCQDQSIPSSPCHNPPCPPQDSISQDDHIMPPYPPKAPIISLSPPCDPNILVQVVNKPLISQMDSPTSIGSGLLCDLIISSIPYPPQNGLMSSSKSKNYPISQRINQGQ